VGQAIHTIFAYDNGAEPLLSAERQEMVALPQRMDSPTDSAAVGSSTS